MSTKSYVINFTDPTKSTITVPAGDSFGPNSISRFTDIELLGMGHTFWGEKLNENLLHMLENFASNEDLHAIDRITTTTTSPDTSKFAILDGDFTKSFISGSVIEIVDSALNDGSYSVLSSVVSGTETLVEVAGTLSTTTPLGSAGEHGTPDKSSFFSPTNAITGQLWYNQTAGKIFVFNQTGSPLTSGIGVWKPLDSFTVSGSEPLTPSSGDLWWDSSVGDGRNLKIYISGWEDVVPDAFLRLDGTKTMTGNINMGNQKIVNVGDASVGTDALNMNTGDGRYVNVTGDTMSGQLTINNNLIIDNNGVIDMQNSRIIDVGDPTGSSHAMSRLYADTRYVNSTGDIMTGILSMSTNRITSVGNATTGTDALNWNTADGRYVNINGDTMTDRLTLSADPTNNLHAATKQYVDNSGTIGINAVARPTEFAIPITTTSNYSASNAWTTISIGAALAGATYVMIVAKSYYIANSSGNTSMRVFARDPAESGNAHERWIFVYSGGNPTDFAYLVGSGTTVVKTGGPSSNPTIEIMATQSGNVAPSADGRIVAWW